jgi:hypothetical protein
MSFFKGGAAKSTMSSFFGGGSAKKVEISQSNASSSFSQIPQVMTSFLNNFPQNVYDDTSKVVDNLNENENDDEDVVSMVSSDDDSKMIDDFAEEDENFENMSAYGTKFHNDNHQTVVFN